MTPSQPPPPPPPSGEALAKIREENKALAEQIANRELRAEAGVAARPEMGVVKGSDGVITVTRRDGSTLRIDPKAVPDEDEVASLVRTALAPPPAPRPRGGNSGEDVAIVAIVFPCLIVVLLIVWRIVATAKRQGAGSAAAAGVPAELAGRLARIEQAIEAVAIEVERISESERYSARLLTERLPEALPARAATAPAPNAPR